MPVYLKNKLRVFPAKFECTSHASMGSQIKCHCLNNAWQENTNKQFEIAKRIPFRNMMALELDEIWHSAICLRADKDLRTTHRKAEHGKAQWSTTLLLLDCWLLKADGCSIVKLFYSLQEKRTFGDYERALKWQHRLLFIYWRGRNNPNTSLATNLSQSQQTWHAH